MNSKNPITLDALHILDAIDRRGSFSSAANELNKAPSSLTYQVQKLEQELDIMIFDRSGHRASFTQAGKLILEQGREILSATEKMVNDASVLANGWELEITLAFDGVIPVRNFFGLVNALTDISSTRIKLQEEILAGGWEALNTGRADLLVCPKMVTVQHDLKVAELGIMEMEWVASSDHLIHKRNCLFDDNTREKYRIIVIADTAREQPAISVNIMQRQPRLTVTNFAAKVEALKAGLGIGTLPKMLADDLIQQGLLRKIEGSEIQPVEIILAWKRDKMGEAKAWCIQHLIKNFQRTAIL
ncbi:LysR family transcriptional regulator [Vibrio caribbeanicus]|uniref:LysR family transcriptional regulator n=1 Tax=Vibrio caribbeanicus TaxID=701175 RepID=UPI00228380DF|nr:LysR family transcriptional regulator [Vibrio caribbeanicus]MCY9843581.1 LysR family transcriptional regulator [Vibrio caribbeanicus]